MATVPGPRRRPLAAVTVNASNAVAVPAPGDRGCRIPPPPACRIRWGSERLPKPTPAALKPRRSHSADLVTTVTVEPADRDGGDHRDGGGGDPAALSRPRGTPGVAVAAQPMARDNGGTARPRGGEYLALDSPGASAGTTDQPVDTDDDGSDGEAGE